MKYPCKVCLVKPACSHACNEYNKFMKRLSELWSPLIILIACIMLMLTFFILIIHNQTNTEGIVKEYFKWLWWSSMITLLLLDRKVFFEHILISVLLAPIMVPSMVAWKIQSRIYKRF
jgi:uncharacterized integral membrane protein